MQKKGNINKAKYLNNTIYKTHNELVYIKERGRKGKDRATTHRRLCILFEISVQEWTEDSKG
jgi:hypothetical protein